MARTSCAGIGEAEIVGVAGIVESFGGVERSGGGLGEFTLKGQDFFGGLAGVEILAGLGDRFQNFV